MSHMPLVLELSLKWPLRSACVLHVHRMQASIRLQGFASFRSCPSKRPRDPTMSCYGVAWAHTLSLWVSLRVSVKVCPD